MMSSNLCWTIFQVFNDVWWINTKDHDCVPHFTLIKSRDAYLYTLTRFTCLYLRLSRLWNNGLLRSVYISIFCRSSTQRTAPQIHFVAVPQCSSWCRDGNSITATHLNSATCSGVWTMLHCHNFFRVHTPLSLIMDTRIVYPRVWRCHCRQNVVMNTYSQIKLRNYNYAIMLGLVSCVAHH